MAAFAFRRHSERSEEPPYFALISTNFYQPCHEFPVIKQFLRPSGAARILSVNRILCGAKRSFLRRKFGPLGLYRNFRTQDNFPAARCRTHNDPCGNQNQVLDDVLPLKSREDRKVNPGIVGQQIQLQKRPRHLKEQKASAKRSKGDYILDAQALDDSI
ncbi:MAG: hypothetical protein ABI147_00145 [Acidobacteriaceae bacterium]